MNSKMQAVKLVTVLVAFFAVIIFPINSYANHSWNNYHWARTSNPFTLTVVDSTTSTWTSQQNTAISDWSASSVMNLVAVQGDESTNARRRCVMISGKIHSCNYTYGSNGWLGLASINISGSHITQGSSKMNDTYFNTSTYNNPNEKLHVMCQEIGHTFGLGHTSEDGSSQNTCMDYFSNTGANATSTLSTRPNQHDYDMLASIYAHLDSTTTIAASSASSVPASEEVTNEPNSWGQLMSQSANGRSSTYEREHSNGSKTATHVFWTEEVAENCPRCDHRYQ
jgi:predicted Zn-dependent protease